MEIGCKNKINRSQRREVVRPWGSKDLIYKSEKSHRFWIVGKKHSVVMQIMENRKKWLRKLENPIKAVKGKENKEYINSTIS